MVHVLMCICYSIHIFIRDMIDPSFGIIQAHRLGDLRDETNIWYDTLVFWVVAIISCKSTKKQKFPKKKKKKKKN